VESYLPIDRLALATLFVSLALGISGCGSSASPSSAPPGSTAPVDNSANTVTPIKHVIFIVGENRSFDNLFATYQPQDPTQSVFNLLSEGIVTTAGTPGPNFSIAAQQQASDTDAFLINPDQTGEYATLPRPSEGENLLTKSFAETYQVSSDPGLALADQYLINIGGYWPGPFLPDYRFPATMPSGPYAITNYVSYPATTGDPVHRFYQMWQQSDCDTSNATAANPSGCRHDLYPWVGVTVGWGFPTLPPPSDLPDYYTIQGGVSMGYYNMANGDVPYFASLAQQFAMSDNYHQFQFGGTGPNSITIGTAAPLIFTDSNGNPATPPTINIENPNPFAGSNNYYQNDGWFPANPGSTSIGSYTNCSDPTQDGVASIQNFLNSLPYKPFNGGNCGKGNYYLLNNQLPAYDRTGVLFTDQSHTVGPSSVPTIGDSLSAANITWRFYGEGYSSPTVGGVGLNYCDICNPFQYAKSIMTTSLIDNLQDIGAFYTDVQNNTLPAVSWIKPDDITDGHPGTSMPIMFEAFTRNAVQAIQNNPALWGNTAIFITTDESGGLYDSGYIQPIDFFGDGPRIPLILVSKYAKPGYVDHTYGDHASLIKFVDYNWSLKPLSSTSRDNLPNPTTGATPYIPGNSPALGDLTSMFNF
jgi:phospholipase C